MDQQNISERMNEDLKGVQRTACACCNAFHLNPADQFKYSQLDDSHPFSVLVRTLKNSRLVDGFIKFDSFIQCREFHFPSRGIMVRECYPRLKDLMLANKSLPFHIGGTPGTGKSAFMCYLLFCVIHAHDQDWPADSAERDYHSVLFDTGNELTDDRFLLWRRDQPILSIGKSVPLVCLNRYGVLQLTECETERPPLAMGFTTSVIAASSQKYRQANIHKIPDLKSYFMPVWSLQELIDCLQSIFNETRQEKIDILKKLYKFYGGVPRSVIDKGVMQIENESTLEKYIDLLKSQVSEHAHKILVKVDPDYDKGEQSHSLVHYDVDDNTFEKTGVVFASREIADLVVDTSLKHSGLGMIEFLEDYLSTKLLSEDTSRRFFETCALKIIADGGKFPSAQAFYTTTASNITSQNQPSERTLTAYARTVRYGSLKDVKAILADPHIEQTLFVPQSTVNPKFHAFSFPNNVFRFIVSKKHYFKPSAIFHQLMNLMRSYSQSKQANRNQKLNFYWVLPENSFDSFAIKPANDLTPEQRVIQDQMDQQLVHIKLKIVLTTST